MTDAQQLSPEPSTPLTKERVYEQLGALYEASTEARDEIAQVLVDEDPKQALRILQQSVREWDWIKRVGASTLLRLLAAHWQQVAPQDEECQTQHRLCVAMLERLVRDEDYDVREAAVIGLASTSPDAFGARLPKLLSDESNQVIKQALLQIGALGLAAQLEQARAHLTSDDGDLRSAAVSTVYALDTGAAKELVLTEAATSDNWYGRRAAAQALQRFGTPHDAAQIALLEELLLDDDSDVQRVAFGALCQISPDDAVTRAKSLSLERPHLLPQTFPFLVSTLAKEELLTWCEENLCALRGSDVQELVEWYGRAAPAEKLPALFEQILQVTDDTARNTMANWVLTQSDWKAERFSFYKACWESPTESLQTIGLKGLWHEVETEQRLMMLKRALEAETYQLGEAALELLSVLEDLAPYAPLLPLIAPLVESDYHDVQRRALQVMIVLTPEKRLDYLGEAFNGDWTMRQMAMEYCEAYSDPRFAPLIERGLADDDGDVRQAAMKALAALAPEAQHSLVAPLCEHDSWDVRRQAMQLLKEHPDPAYVPLILKGLEDSDYDVRQAAAEAARGVIGEAPKTFAQFAAVALQDDSWGVRRELAQAFVAHGTADMLPLLEPLLEDGEVDVAVEAFSAFMKLAPPTKKLSLALHACARGDYRVGDIALEVLQDWEDFAFLCEGLQAYFVDLVGEHANRLLDLVSAHETLPEIPPARSVLPGLLARIPDVKDADARASLAGFVAGYPGDEQLPLLRRFWEDPEGSVRCQGYLGLRKWCPDEAVALSKEAIRSDYEDLKIHALSFFAELGDTSHRPLIEDALDSYQNNSTRKAFVVLCQLFPEERRALALQHRTHYAWTVREEVARVLGEVGGPDDLEAFKPLLESDYQGIRHTALLTALDLIPDAQLMPYLLNAYCGYHDELKSRATAIIDAWPDRERLYETAAAQIPKVPDDTDPTPLFRMLSENAPQHMHAVLPQLDRVYDDAVQLEFLTTCIDSDIGVPIPVLRKMLEESSNSNLRKEVYERLCAALPGERLLLTAKLLEDDDWTMRQFALEVLGEEEEPDPALLADLLPLARDHDYDVRMNALRTIARFNDPRAYSEMIGALDDENESVREVAQECLRGGPEKMPILKRFAHLRGDEPIWVRMKRQLEEIHDWVRDIGYELLGRSVLITQPGHKNMQDEGEEARKGLVEIVLPDTPITQLHPHAEEVMRALALYKLGHFLYNEGTRGYKTMRGIAKSEGIVEIYDLLTYERVERNLRARRDAWGPLLDRLTSYAFSKTIYRIPIDQYATLVEATPEETLAQVSSGALPGQLLPSKRPGQHIVSLRDRDLILIPNALPPLMAFVWCLRCGYEAKLHPNPVVSEAIALLPGNLKGMAHAKVLQLARDIAALLGSSDAHKQQFQDMMDKLMGKEGEKNQATQGKPGECQGGQGGQGGEGGAPGGSGQARGGPGKPLRPSALRAMMRQHLERLTQAGGTPDWMSPNETPKRGQHEGRVRKHRQVIYRRQPSGNKGAGGQAINLGKDLDFDLLPNQKALSYSATAHAEIVGPIRKHIRRLRSYFERLGRSTQDEYASRRGSRLDVAQARRLLYTTTANLLVHTYEEIQADLYLGVLIDRSGSMEGEKIRVAKSFGALVAESARSIRGIEGHVNAFDDDTFYYMGDFQRSGIAQLEAGGGNNDAGGLHRAAQLAMASRKKNRLLIMISDGSPTECTVDALRNFVQRLDKDYQIRCAQVAVESLSDITFPHYVDLSQYPLDEAVSRFGKLLIKLTTSWR